MSDQAPSSWSLRIEARDWQRKALEEWLARMRGVMSVVTGGGKTVLAFLCMHEFLKKCPSGRVIVLVPTITLLDQWYVGLQEDFGVPAEEIACFSSQEKANKPRVVNVLVINSGRKLVRKLAAAEKTFLIVDECHRAGSPENAKALKGEFVAALGLSATPQREYDQGFEEHVVPALGPVIFEYDYARAFEDGVVAPFDLVNVQVDLLPHEQTEYDRLSKRAAMLLRKARTDVGVEEKLKRVLQLRAAVSATAKMRIPVAAKIVEQNRGARTIVFHERVSSAKALFDVLQQRRHSVCLYHSKIAPEVRRDNLRLFRRGVFDVLISCRALDEGMNVPETTVAVIASSTASQRQRIQRLGRVLRPAKGKQKAIIYTLYATEQEHRRLSKEYFTPRHDIDMCVRMLNPTVYEYLIDTAGGSCGFTVHSIFHVWGNEFTADGPKTWQAEYAAEKVFAIDFDPRSIKIAKALNLIAGDGRTHVYRANTLDPRNWSDEIKVGLRDRLARLPDADRARWNRENYRYFGFDVLMTNPPFAGDIRDSRILHQFDLAQKQKGKWHSKVGRDILFIERNLEFLKPGGRSAIVLPQGRLNNSGDKPIRDYIAERARILAVVGLHGNTFKPHTGTKTSIVFLQKWNDNPKAGPLCRKLDDYPIFFAVSQNGGKDNSGEYIYLPDDKGRPLYDLHGHPMVDHDLFNLRRYLTNQYHQRLSAARTAKEKEAIEKAYAERLPFVPDRPGIAEAFREWGRKQGFAFCREAE